MLAVDVRAARPLPPGTADADRVAQRAAFAQHQIEPALVGAHHDRSRRSVAIEGDHFTGRSRRRDSGKGKKGCDNGRGSGDTQAQVTHNATSN